MNSQNVDEFLDVFEFLKKSGNLPARIRVGNISATFVANKIPNPSKLPRQESKHLSKEESLAQLELDMFTSSG